MTKGRLTQKELGWLLTQEAQGAAERVRMGVQLLRTSMVPPALETRPADEHAGSEPPELDATLDALDDAMRMLSTLHQRSGRGRRGRIDIAALLWELAPDARVALEPGSGTEVFGDEDDFRRMLQVLLGGAGSGAELSVRREGDSVVVTVPLGSEGAVVIEAERAWLSRMAVRYGGRYETSGAEALIALPAEGVRERSERAALQRELDEARQQGEMYARELAAVMAQRGGVHTSSPPPPGELGTVGLLAHFSRGLAAELRGLMAPLSRELGSLRIHNDQEERLESLKRRGAQVQEWLAELSSLGELESDEEPAVLDLVELLDRVLEQWVQLRAASRRVTLDYTRPSTPLAVRLAPRASCELLRKLLIAAVASSPPLATVTLTLESADDGFTLHVDDAGPPLPTEVHTELLALQVEPSTYGRAAAVPYYVAAKLARALGLQFSLADAPGGGLRVSVSGRLLGGSTT